MLLASFLFVSCNSVNVDTSEWSGITNQNDEKSKIVECNFLQKSRWVLAEGVAAHPTS